MPQPSPRTKPLAAASKVLQRPSGESMPHFEIRTNGSGDRMTLTPPASTSWLSPLRRLWHAVWIATSDDEHAVSMAMQGPRSPRVKEMRPAAALSAVPVAR